MYVRTMLGPSGRHDVEWSSGTSVTSGSSDRVSDWSLRMMWRGPKLAMPRSITLVAMLRSANRSSIASATNREPTRCRSPK